MNSNLNAIGENSQARRAGTQAMVNAIGGVRGVSTAQSASSVLSRSSWKSYSRPMKDIVLRSSSAGGQGITSVPSPVRNSPMPTNLGPRFMNVGSSRPITGANDGRVGISMPVPTTTPSGVQEGFVRNNVQTVFNRTMNSARTPGGGFNQSRTPLGQQFINFNYRPNPTVMPF